MRRILTATRNPAKVAQLARLVAGWTQVESLPDDVAFADDEPGDALATIAAGKAVTCSRLVDPDTVVLASDGGLLVPGLGDAWNPLRTRRFAGDGATGVAHAEALLKLSSPLAGAGRQVGWREALAVASGGTLLATWVAESAPGMLAHDYDARLIEAGGGFWVPALWCCPEHDGRRLAELSDEERRRRGDHWARLGLQLRAFLSELR